MSKKVADVIVEMLEAAGVKHCYGIVGDTLNRFAEMIDKSSIKWVHMRHEEAGAFAAQGEALTTGNLTAIAGSCGPGSLHFINGVVEANRNGAPVILIASQVPRNELGFDFVQEVDFKSIYKTSSVFCEMIHTVDQARRMTAMACQAALSKRGVAVLIVPVDVSEADAADELPYSVHASPPAIRPSDSDLQKVADILNSGSNIAIYGGAGCDGARDEVIAIAERLLAPIAHSSRGKNALGDNPYNVGMTGIIGMEAGYHTLLESDTLLLLGTNFAWSQFYPSKAKIVQIDIDPTHIGRRHPVTLGLVGDVKTTLTALLPLLKQNDNPSFRDAFTARYKKDIASMREKAVATKEGLRPTYLAELLNQLAADDALFCCDDGTVTVWMHQQIELKRARRTYASLLHGTMAGGLPTAIGLQTCQPGRQVVCMAGDGGLAMLMGELLTVVQCELPIKIVVFNNHKLGFVEMEQKAEGMQATYTDLKNPDFGKVAEAIGMWGGSVKTAAELEPALKTWLAQPGPALLDVHVNPMHLVNPPFIAAKAVYGMALYSTRAILSGNGGEVWELIKENYL